ncbi:DNA-binding protein [Affinibrenneria salicis]|uniref:DNA-binding protein n=1 Tax=Affinibrenneria salicis TaxID=2590031 RepID=UPI00168BFE6F|nr:DNA-binding protein [Affinibrenneria salicis]
MAPGGKNVQLQDQQGNAYRIGKLIKSGGAGSVSHIDNASGKVSKVYHDKIDKPYHQRKITAMLALRPEIEPVIVHEKPIVQLAWPEAPLFDRNKRFVGFVMPELDVRNTIELEYILQERQAKAHQLPTGLGAKVSLSYNLCSLVEALHRQGHRIIDMKPLNLRFYKSSLYMALLDCDGFSIQGVNERFPAGQFTVEYLAPEFQKAQKVPENQEEWQDRFALAVIVFQLLNFGIHPFSGRPADQRVPTDIPGRIAGRFYAYGQQAHRQIAPIPASGHAAMPAGIRLLFDQAFAGPPSQRPSARQWADCLRDFARPEKKQLLVCGKNTRHQYFAGFDCAACARQEQLQQAHQQQKQRRRTPTIARQTGGTIAAQTALRRPPPARVQPFALSHLLPRVVWHTLFAMLVPLIFGWLLQTFVPVSASGVRGAETIAGLMDNVYFDQITSGILFIFLFIIAAIFGLLLFVWPSLSILRRKP